MKQRHAVHAGKYLSFVVENDYEFAHRHRAKGVVAMVPITDDQNIVLVEQFRIPLGKSIVELPAGLVGDEDQNEDFEDSAARELVEETGFEARSMRLIGTWPTSSGMTTEIVQVYLATGLKKVGNGGGVDPGEDITVHVVPLSKVATWLREQEKRGAYVDPKIMAGLYLWEHEKHA